MMGYGGYGAGSGLGWLGMIVELLFWVGLTLLVVWVAVRLLSNRRADGEDTALEILRRRYASGEISTEEYNQARNELA
ncbi:MAG: SHOCT domain-containing protein [Actinobacteria bacterium]|nr:SHOCT domain-containing protein [Actinomycetota bacterium]